MVKATMRLADCIYLTGASTPCFHLVTRAPTPVVGVLPVRMFFEEIGQGMTLADFCDRTCGKVTRQQLKILLDSILDNLTIPDEIHNFFDSFERGWSADDFVECSSSGITRDQLDDGLESIAGHLFRELLAEEIGSDEPANT